MVVVPLVLWKLEIIVKEVVVVEVKVVIVAVVVVEVAVIKDVCSRCSSKSFCSSFRKRISSVHVVVKVTGLPEKVSSCSRSSRSGRSKSNFNSSSSNNSRRSTCNRGSCSTSKKEESGIKCSISTSNRSITS